MSAPVSYLVVTLEYAYKRTDRLDWELELPRSWAVSIASKIHCHSCRAIARVFDTDESVCPHDLIKVGGGGGGGGREGVEGVE
jgi:hypothetical protein